MIRTKSLLLGAALVLGTVLPAAAQPFYPYPPFPSPYPQAPAAPPAWSYDPYTSGFGPCPQRHPGDPPCSVTMQPTIGQPSYWPVR